MTASGSDAPRPSCLLCHGLGCTSSWSGRPLLRRCGHTASPENLSSLPSALRDLPVVRSGGTATGLPVGACVTGLFAYPLFWLLDTGSPPLVWLAIVVALVFSHAPMYGPQAAFFSELFGTRVRYSGASLGSQLSSVVAGGLSPFIATPLLPYGRGALASYIIAMALVTIAAVLIASRDPASHHRMTWCVTAHEPRRRRDSSR